MSKINWFTVIAVCCVIGGLVVGGEIWVNGAENYSSASRHGDTFTWLMQGLAGLIGDKATAVFIFVGMSVVAYLIYKLGQLRRP